MSGFLLDTNVISELRRLRPHAAVIGFVAAQPEENLFVSDVTFAEIRFGIEQLDDPERRASIIAWLDHTLHPLFDGRTLPISEDFTLRWRLQLENGRRRGHNFGQFDLFIAATSAENDLIVVSRDTIHFIAVLDPWTGRFTASNGEMRSIKTVDDSSLLKTLSQPMQRPGRK